jgi:hypothetical protein
MWDEYFVIKIALWLAGGSICLILYRRLFVTRTYPGYLYFVTLGLVGPFVSPDCMCMSIRESIIGDATIAAFFFSVAFAGLALIKRVKHKGGKT